MVFQWPLINWSLYICRFNTYSLLGIWKSMCYVIFFVFLFGYWDWTQDLEVVRHALCCKLYCQPSMCYFKIHFIWLSLKITEAFNEKMTCIHRNSVKCLKYHILSMVGPNQGFRSLEIIGLTCSLYHCISFVIYITQLRLNVLRVM